MQGVDQATLLEIRVPVQFHRVAGEFSNHRKRLKMHAEEDIIKFLGKGGNEFSSRDLTLDKRVHISVLIRGKGKKNVVCRMFRFQ